MALEERSATLPGERVLPLTPGTAILHLRARGADALAWLRESSSTSTAAHVLAVLFFFTALYTLFFSPALFSSRILAPGDGISFYLNTFYGARSLWADELFAGFPIGADPQSMTWYPPAWLFSGLGASYNAFVISAYILGSSLMYGYVYSVTNSRFGALIGGITYGLCGFMMARVGHLTIIHVAAWGPLIIWSLEKLRERPQRAWMAVLAAAIALCALAGHSQMTLYILSLAAAYGVVRGWRAPAGAIRYYGISVVSLVLGIGMSAVCLLPAYQLSQESARSSLNFLDFSAFPLPWKQLPQLLFPSLFTELRGWAVYGTSYFGEPRSNLPESAGFISFVPLLLGLVAISLNRRSALTWFWVLAAVFGVLLSIGNATPLARILFEIPIYNGFRAPGRYLIVVSFSMSVLAGLGAASVLRVEGRARARAIVLASVTVIAAAAVILAGIVVFAETLRYWARTRIGVTEISIRPWENPAIGVPLIMLAASLSALWLWARWPRGWSGALLIAVLVLDLGSFGWFQEWRGSPPSSALDRPSVLADYGNALAVAHQRLTPLRGISQTPELAAPNLSRVWALPSAAGYNPYLLERYRTLVSMDPTGPLRLDALSPENTALNILAVRYLFAPALPADSPEAQTLAADPSRWRKIQNLLSGAVYENEGALPRARLVPEVLTVSPSQDLAAIQHSVLPDGRRYDPRTTALVEEPVAFERQQTGSRGTAQIVRDGHTMIEIQVESDSPAFLVLADTYYPGWRASVDGKPAEVLRTDYALRGVAVPRGSHIVQFEYHPAILRAAEVISGLSVLGVLAILGLPLLVRSATGLASVKRRVTSGQAR